MSDEEEDAPADWLAPGASHSVEQGHEDGFPMRRLSGSIHSVPDFGRIPAERWEEAMRMTPRRLRLDAARGLPISFEQMAALARLAMSDLPPAPSDLAREAVLARPVVRQASELRRTRRAFRQVNFRLTAQEYEELAVAAELLGHTPTRLAAELVRHGVQRVIEDANRPAG